MFGAIIGDFVGSFYEGKGIKGYSLDLLTPGSAFTDETVLMAATADVVMSESRAGSLDFARTYKDFGNRYPGLGYGPDFEHWLSSDSLSPYGSSGAGSASRVSPIGFLDLPERVLLDLAEQSSSATHDSPDAIRCSQAVVLAIHQSLCGLSPDQIAHNIESTFYLPLRFDWEDLHQNYGFSSYCEEIVPQAIFIGLKARSFEDAMRKGLYVGGDTDTIMSIAGAIAQARSLHPKEALKLRVHQELEKKLPEVCALLQSYTSRAMHSGT